MFTLLTKLTIVFVVITFFTMVTLVTTVTSGLTVAMVTGNAPKVFPCGHVLTSVNVNVMRDRRQWEFCSFVGVVLVLVLVLVLLLVICALRVWMFVSCVCCVLCR
jgi:hypothetical protein